MNIAFYISGNAGRLRKLIDSGSTDILNDTKLVFSDDGGNADLKMTVNDLGGEYELLEYKTISDASLPKNRVLSDALLRSLRRLDVDYCFSFGAHILSGELLDAYENRIINFHPSILPLYPGKLSIDTAVAGHSNLLGNTAHFIDAGVDTGPIIMQNIVSSKVFTGNNYDAILDNQIPMLHQIYLWLKEGRINVDSRSVVIKDADYEESSYYPRIECA